jgi:hypothetical protein
LLFFGFLSLSLLLVRQSNPSISKSMSDHHTDHIDTRQKRVRGGEGHLQSLLGLDLVHALRLRRLHLRIDIDIERPRISGRNWARSEACGHTAAMLACVDSIRTKKQTNKQTKQNKTRRTTTHATAITTTNLLRGGGGVCFGALSLGLLLTANETPARTNARINISYIDNFDNGKTNLSFQLLSATVSVEIRQATTTNTKRF